MTSTDESIALRLAVGHATIEAAIAEELLEGLLVGLLESRDATELSRYNTLDKRTRECRRRLKERQDLAQNQDEALALLDQLDELRRRRNRLIHDVVAMQQTQGANGTTSGFVQLRGMFRGPSKSQPISVEEIYELAAGFRSVSGALILWAFTNLPYLRQQWNSN